MYFGRAKKELCLNRLWLLGMNQNRSGLAIARDWTQMGCSPRQASYPPVQATSCAFVSAYRKVLQPRHFTRRAIPPQYKIGEQKKIPSERQYPRCKRRLGVRES